MKTSLHVVLLCVALVLPAKAQKSSPPHPGAEAYTPAKIEWLATVLQADLRTELTEENKFLLSITYRDPETILIYVRYLPTVQREIMNTTIAGAREVIKTTAKSYGWDVWVKIEEDVQVAGSPRLNDPTRTK